jgi:hypothetical protein
LTQATNAVTFTRGSGDIWFNLYDITLSASPAVLSATSGSLSGGAAIGTGGDGLPVVYFPQVGGADAMSLPNSAGTKSLVIHYSNANAAGTVTVSINGGAGSAVNLPSTGSWAVSSTVTIPVSLTQATNTVTFTRGSGDIWFNLYDVSLSAS